MENRERLKIEYVRVDDIIPYDKNPRRNDRAVDAVAASMRSFGFKVPIVIDENNVIVCGHTRIKAAKRLGIEEAPCVRAVDLTPEQIRAFRVADNKVSELAEWDDALLAGEVAALPEFDFEQFGFDLGDIAPQGDVDTEEDAFDVDAEPEAVFVKPGEVWRCGDHRLMVGDATNPGDIARLMAGDLADLVITDPPYNVGYEGLDGMTIRNDSMEDAKFREFLTAAFRNMASSLKPGGAFYVWHADSEGYNFRGACRDAGLKVRQCLVWKKNELVIGWQDYKWIHEPCLYGWRDGAAHEFHGGMSQTTVLEFGKPQRSKLHPTMKPVALFAHQMANSSKEGDIVLDPFGGSGTTMVCAERAGRRARLMEIDPTYAQRIINRWQEDSGKKAVLLDPGCGGGGAASEDSTQRQQEQEQQGKEKGERK